MILILILSYLWWAVFAQNNTEVIPMSDSGSWIEIFGVDVGEGLFILGLKKGKTEGSIGLLTARGEECTDEYAAG